MVTLLDQRSYGITVELPQEIRWKGLVWSPVASTDTRLPREQFNPTKV